MFVTTIIIYHWISVDIVMCFCIRDDVDFGDDKSSSIITVMKGWMFALHTALLIKYWFQTNKQKKKKPKKGFKIIESHGMHLK